MSLSVVAVLALLATAQAAVPRRLAPPHKDGKLSSATLAAKGQFPFLAAVLGDINPSYIYTGTFINGHLILISGSAAIGHLNWVVYMGTVDFEDVVNRFEDIITSEPIILTAETVALLKLNKFPQISAAISPVILPQAVDNFDLARVEIAGWGSGSSATISLQYYVSTAVSNYPCGSLTDFEHICTPGPSHICVGDLGAPLVETETRKLVGIANAVVGTCGTGTENKFLYVPGIVTWLNSH